MSWEDYDDEWPDTETEQERIERAERARQYQIALRVKQSACLHANAIPVGSGFEISAEGQMRRYITLYCGDCELGWDVDTTLYG